MILGLTAEGGKANKTVMKICSFWPRCPMPPKNNSSKNPLRVPSERDTYEQPAFGMSARPIWEVWVASGSLKIAQTKDAEGPKMAEGCCVL